MALQNLISLNETQTDEAAQQRERSAWHQLQHAANFEAFAAAWLSLQCGLIGASRRGVILCGPPERGPYLPVAFWPEEKGGSLGVLSAADLAIAERRGVLRDSPVTGTEQQLDQASCGIAIPLLVDGRLHGAIAIELSARGEPALRAAMRALQWGSGWLEARLRRGESGRFAPANRRLASLLDTVSTAIEEPHFPGAAMAIVTGLATMLGCERVSLGFTHGRHTRVSVVSHSAQFTQRSNLATSIGALMDEAVDQCSTLVYPKADGAPARTLHYHADFAKTHGGCALCTVTIGHGDSMLGAMVFERPGEVVFDDETIEFCEAVAAIVGPILHLRKADERWPIRKLWDACKDFTRRLVGPKHLWLKANTCLLAVAAVFLSFATGEYRVAAETRVEGRVQRVVASPIDGYIKSSQARSGDLVRKDEILAQLDDRDLLLERTKSSSQQQQYRQEYREALAKADRAGMAVLQAQLGQAEAELSMVDAKLARIRILAPLDGVIVSGDLSHSLGAPVAQGDTLFTVAPLDAYRVILEVDERDFGNVRVGQTGKLVLTGRPDVILSFAVDKITLVTEEREGRNYFRVEAKLASTPDFLRPGMKGTGKIVIGERKLAWIWTHNLTEWLRLALWTYWP